MLPARAGRAPFNVAAPLGGGCEGGTPLPSPTCTPPPPKVIGGNFFQNFRESKIFFGAK